MPGTSLISTLSSRRGSSTAKSSKMAPLISVPSQDSLSGTRQLMLRAREKQTESYSIEELRNNVPASAMVNPYINRLVRSAFVVHFVSIFLWDFVPLLVGVASLPLASRCLVGTRAAELLLSPVF